MGLWLEFGRNGLLAVLRQGGVSIRVRYRFFEKRFRIRAVGLALLAKGQLRVMIKIVIRIWIRIRIRIRIRITIRVRIHVQAEWS